MHGLSVPRSPRPVRRQWASRHQAPGSPTTPPSEGYGWSAPPRQPSPIFNCFLEAVRELLPGESLFPKVVTQNLPLTPASFPCGPNAAAPASNAGCEPPLKSCECAANRHRSKVLASRGNTPLPAPAPPNPRSGTQARRGRRAPWRSAGSACTFAQRERPRNSGKGALRNNAAPQTRGPPRPHGSRRARRSGYSPRGIKGLPNPCGWPWGAGGGEQIRTPPPAQAAGGPVPALPAQVAGGTHTSSPRF